MDEKNKIEQFYLELSEPQKATLLYLREFILSQDSRINECWRFGTPFFYLEKKMFCYFWFDKGNQAKPYLSFADGYRMQHPALESGGRKRFKVYPIMLNKDIQVDELQVIFKEALSYYP